MVFNIDSNLNERCDMDDKKKIAELGGVSALARRLNVTPQRVQNWTKRGIPAKVKLDNYELFHNANKSKWFGLNWQIEDVKKPVRKHGQEGV